METSRGVCAHYLLGYFLNQPRNVRDIVDVFKNKTPLGRMRRWSDVIYKCDMSLIDDRDFPHRINIVVIICCKCLPKF